MIKGSLKADAIAIMEILSCSFLGGADNPRMRARAAFVKSDGGATLGQLDHENWSKNTLEKLKALREAMEEDIAGVYFVDHVVSEGAGSTSTTAGNVPRGLADHLGSTDDAQQG